MSSVPDIKDKIWNLCHWAGVYLSGFGW